MTSQGDLKPAQLYEQHLMETYRGLVPLAAGAIKTALLLNGGAAIALLALLGNFASAEKSPLGSIEQLKCALMWFVAGLACAGATSIVAYISQLTLYDEVNLPHAPRRPWRKSNPMVGLGVALVSFSVALFVFGCVSAQSAF